jgi:hypothetical protein
MSNFLDLILSMIRVEEPDYNLLNNNISLNLLNNYFKQKEESKSLYQTRNFPIMSCTEEFIIPLRCVINNKPINIPAKTKSCQHIEFMELETLFKYIFKFGHCPLCIKEINKHEVQNKEKVLGVDTIYIDFNLNTIFQGINRNNLENNITNYGMPFEFIIINKHTLKWRPYDPRKTNIELNKEISKLFSEDFRKDIEIITDDENPSLTELREMNNYLGQEKNKIEFQLSTLLNKLNNN